MASAPEQMGLLELSVAATGKAFTVTVAVAVNGREQVPLLTLVRFKDVFTVTAVTVTLTVPPAPIVAVQMLHLYNLYFPVPVIVKKHNTRTNRTIRTKCCCHW
jgi:hypothetical protein